jgi:phospholipid transport system substrate-binding protein
MRFVASRILGRAIAAVLALSLFAAAASAASEETPLAAVRGAIDQAISILHDRQMPVEQRRRELRQLAEANLDLARMAKGALGDHWSELTPGQRDRIVALFAAFIETAYLDQIQDYVKLNINVASGSISGPNDARVSATVVQPGEGPTPIVFVLERQTGKWIVYDVDVEGISMVENYRAQFDRVIRIGGIPQLMAKLKEKETKLNLLLGQSPS